MRMRVYDRTVLPLEVSIRTCTRGDLEGLEWYGLYSLHRQIIHDAFARQEAGEVLMLLAVASSFPIGQAWIDFAARPDERDGVGVLWAVRVYPFLQGFGVGTRLLAAAERAVRERGARWAEIGVEKDNPRARQLYERNGYRLHREMVEEFSYLDWHGNEVRVEVDEWILRKDLSLSPRPDGHAPRVEPVPLRRAAS